MHLERIRDQATEFRLLENPNEITSARIWHCNYRTLAPLSRLTNLLSLRIASYPDPTLALLAPLQRLAKLEILHLPNVSNLDSLGSLTSLRCLCLMTLPSWDSSAKVTVVESLGPIANLPQLEELQLFGVVPRQRNVDDILSSKSLRRVKLSKYPPEEMQRIDEHWGKRNAG